MKIPQSVAWYNWFLHPVRSWRNYQQNRIVFEKMRLAALDVCVRMDAGDFPKQLITEQEILEWFENELQHAFYEVIK